MKSLGLLRRIQQLEERARPATADGNIHVRFAHVHMLPHTYTGERHRRLVRGTPSENPDNDCLIKEFPGPGPDLHFDFEEGGRTMLVQFVEADGDGHPRATGPKRSRRAPERQLLRQEMRDLERRLRRLEERAGGREISAPHWAQVLLEKQRRRAEENGQPYKAPWRDPTLYENGRWPTWAEVLRSLQARRRDRLQHGEAGRPE